MMVNLNKKDLICLVKGTNGPGSYKYINTPYGNLDGFPNEKWKWNDKYLNSLEDYQLFSLYEEIKEIKNG